MTEARSRGSRHGLARTLGARAGLAALLMVATACSGALAESAGRSVGQQTLSAGPVLDQKLTVDGTTISYPKGLESQAKEVAAVCQSVIPPRRSRFLAVERAFSTHDVAQHVADLLGCPEHAAWAQEVLSAVESAAASGSETVFLPMFSDVRIYREADLKASGGVHTGAMHLSYDGETDSFGLRLEAHFSSGMPGPSEVSSFLPVIVKDDGTFRGRGGLASHVSRLLDEAIIRTAMTMRASFVHEAAEFVLVRLGLDHPYGRWFTEGVATWVELQTVAQLVPELADICREMSLPGPEHRPLRDRINLPAWPRSNYDKRLLLDEELELRRASYPYAAELVDRLFRDQPAGALAEVVESLKGTCSADTDVICQALHDVTGVDAKSLLLEYVPQHVREGLQQGAPRRKSEEAHRALSEGEHWPAIRLLSEVLEMTPSDADAHLSLAIAIRKTRPAQQARRPRDQDGRWQESERHIAIAAALVRFDDSYSFTVHEATDDEALYALGRVEQRRGRTKEAREILATLPEDHADAQAALMELEAAEEAQE